MTTKNSDLQDQQALVTGATRIGRASYITGAVIAADGGRTAI
jgi:hypothetical protein